MAPKPWHVQVNFPGPHYRLGAAVGKMGHWGQASPPSDLLRPLWKQDAGAPRPLLRVLNCKMGLVEAQVTHGTHVDAVKMVVIPQLNPQCVQKG